MQHPAHRDLKVETEEAGGEEEKRGPEGKAKSRKRERKGIHSTVERRERKRGNGVVQ